MTVLNLQVAANGDDVFHSAQFNWNLFTSSAPVGNPGYNGSRLSRFTGVTIANGATISAADFQIRSKDSPGGGTSVDMNLKFINEDNATMPTDGTDWSGRTFTTGVSYTRGTAWSANTWYTISDATSVQTIVNRAGWASGNALVCDLQENASSSNCFCYGNTYEEGSTNAAKLDITYTAGGGSDPIYSGRIPMAIMVR